MSVTNDNSSFTRLQDAAVRGECTASESLVATCGFRSLAGCVPVGALVGALSDVPDELPGSSDRITDLAVAGVAALLLVLFLLWVGKKHGGIVAAIKLTAWSYCFQQAVVVAAAMAHGSLLAWTARNLTWGLSPSTLCWRSGCSSRAASCCAASIRLNFP